MTSEELKEIEERCNKSTPRPWFVFSDDLIMRAVGVRGVFCRKHGLLRDHKLFEPVKATREDEIFVAFAQKDIPDLLAHIKELESQIPRWTPITVAVPDEYEIVLFKMVELVALKGEEKPMKGSDPIPDIFEAFPDTIETRTSYFTGYRMDNIYRDHLHNCVRNYVRLEWVRIFKEEES